MEKEHQDIYNETQIGDIDDIDILWKIVVGIILFLLIFR